MSTPVFTWSPDYAVPQSAHEPRVFKLKFGDGYAQRAGNGLNTDLPTWTLQWTVSSSTAATILAFFKTQAGVTAFLWQGPEDAAQTLWICPKWGSLPGDYNSVVVTATFEQVVA